MASSAITRRATKDFVASEVQGSGTGAKRELEGRVK